MALCLSGPLKPRTSCAVGGGGRGGSSAAAAAAAAAAAVVTPPATTLRRAMHQLRRRPLTVAASALPLLHHPAATLRRGRAAAAAPPPRAAVQQQQQHHTRTLTRIHAPASAPAAALSGKPLQTVRGGGASSARLLGRRAPLRSRGTVRSSTAAVSVSANLFTRLFRIVTSFFNGLVESFEDPEKLLDRVAEEMQEDMIRMRQATAQVMASQRQLVTKQKSLQASAGASGDIRVSGWGGADQWLQRAELAVSRGQDDLAREALKRRKVLQEDADRLNEQVALQTSALEQLQANIRVLEGKLGEARTKKETLKARAASAKTSLALQEMIGGLQVRSGTSWAAFEKMEEKVAQLEAQAQTATALVAPDSLERQFAALEGDTGVDAELAALKRERRGERRQGPPTQLPPPSPQPPLTGVPLRDVFDPLERELEDLRRRARE
ncbi:hypothetical protein PLESTB_000584100 [Pleodorina starrii]|uniref:Uncharacterized protein n=1 Tax=Pleodorina starrii TaxID=330485 RepID=A0A9W6BHF9_9CHLO|nr:hypothetical protein PLESTB_000584100 [Pleodorina starrii]